MTNEQIVKRLCFVVYGDDVNRVHISLSNDGQLIVHVDTHEMKCRAANRMLNNIIGIIQVPFILDIIHGYNSGTAIKDMIQSDINNHRIISKDVVFFNPGETLIQVA